MVQVALTPAGEARLARVEQARHADMTHVLRHFSTEQLYQLEDLLQLLLAGIHCQSVYEDMCEHRVGGMKQSQS